uniref:Uncharacterized protein n=1 Tax=Solanum tuberosum TaxID=4113 RepID=M1B7T2_SOLTU
MPQKHVLCLVHVFQHVTIVKERVAYNIYPIIHPYVLTRKNSERYMSSSLKSQCTLVALS